MEASFLALEGVDETDDLRKVQNTRHGQEDDDRGNYHDHDNHATDPIGPATFEGYAFKHGPPPFLP